MMCAQKKCSFTDHASECLAKTKAANILSLCSREVLVSGSRLTSLARVQKCSDLLRTTQGRFYCFWPQTLTSRNNVGLSIPATAQELSVPLKTTAWNASENGTVCLLNYTFCLTV